MSLGAVASPNWSRRNIARRDAPTRRSGQQHSSNGAGGADPPGPGEPGWKASTSEEEIVKAIQLQWFRCRHNIFKDTTTNFWRMRYERNGAPVPQAERTFMYWRAQYFQVLVQKSAFAILFVTMLALGYDFMQPSVEVWLRVRVRSACACLTVGMITFVHSSLWYHRMCPRVLLFFSFLYACLLISYAITLKDISYGIHICFMFWVLNYLPVPAIDGIIVAFLHTAGYTLGVMVHGGASKSSELEKCGLVCVFLVIMGSGAVNRELALRRNHINLKVSRNQARMLKLEEAAQNALLGSMLPQEMLHELKANAQPNESKLVAEHPEVSVLFCKLDDFTRRTKGMRASVVVGLLNEIWTALDKVVDFHGVYKVETVGEVYMVVSGCPRLVSNHAHLATNTALGMRDTLVQLQQDAWWRESRLPSFQLKMGVHTGPVVAGLLGLRFKLVGDTVNTASRMCSTSQAGAIQLSTTTHAKLMGCRYDYQSNTISVAHTTAYHVKKREPIEVKGKGLMQTYFVRSSTQMVPWEEPIYSLEQGLQNRNELTPLQFSKKNSKIGSSNSSRCNDSPAPLSSKNRQSSIYSLLQGMNKQAKKNKVKPTSDGKSKQQAAAAAASKLIRAASSSKLKVKVPGQGSGNRLNGHEGAGKEQQLSPGSPRRHLANLHNEQNSTQALSLHLYRQPSVTTDISLEREISGQPSAQARALREMLTQINVGKRKDKKESLSPLQVIWLFIGFGAAFVGPDNEDDVEREAAFQASKFDNSVRFCRGTAVLGLIVVLVLQPVLDAWMFVEGTRGHENKIILLIMRAGVVTPILVIFMALTYTRIFLHGGARCVAIFVMLMVCGLAIIVNLALIQNDNNPEPMGLLALFIVYLHFFDLLSVCSRLITSLLLSCAYAFLVPRINPTTDVWDVYRNACYLFCFTIGELFIVFSGEYRQRFDFNVGMECRVQQMLLEEEEAQHLGLLQRMLPATVVDRLLEIRGGFTFQRQQYLADHFECVTILQTDIVGFTSLSSKMTPLQLRFFLNSLYKRFDRVIESHGLYKVEIIGDAMVIAGGVTGTHYQQQGHEGNGGKFHEDVDTYVKLREYRYHAAACCRAALELFGCLSAASSELGQLIGQSADATTHYTTAENPAEHQHPEGMRIPPHPSALGDSQNLSNSLRTRERRDTTDEGYTDLVDLDHAEQVLAASPPTDAKADALLAGALNVRMRVGVHSGPVVAGVVGSKDLRYHVFGESLRIAEAMESNSIPGRILCSAVTFKLLQHDAAAAEFDFTEHDEVNLQKEGLECFETYLVDRAGDGQRHRRNSAGVSGGDNSIRRKNSLSQMRMLMKAKAQAQTQSRPHSSPVSAARRAMPNRPPPIGVTPLL